MRYVAEEIHVDRHPEQSAFVLTYPKGALILNTDTGEGRFLTQDTVTADVPQFKGKTTSFEQHDAERNRRAMAASSEVRLDKLFLIFVANGLAVAAFGAWFLLRRRARRRRGRTSN